MKIAVVGAFSTGKTTLVNDLHSILPFSQVIEDECRPVLGAIGRVDWSLPEIRSYLIVRQIVVESLAGDQVLQIVDGGVINNIAHDRVLLSDPAPRSSLLKALGFKDYDLAFWCDPFEIPIEDDGQRYVDGVLRERLDVEVGLVLNEFGHEVTRLRGTREQRLDLAKNRLLALQ